LDELLPAPSAPDLEAGVFGGGRTFSKIVNSLVIQFSMLHIVLLAGD
jgi:hypothetical protein